MTQNAVQYFNVSEMRRSNRESEAELKRSNLAKERQAWESHQEAIRHNQKLEAIQLAQLEELQRHNREQEVLGHYNVSLGYSNLAETTTAHRNAEAELRRSNLAAEFELMRHNKATEFNAAAGTLITGLKSYADTKVNKYSAQTQRMNAKTNQKTAQIASKSQKLAEKQFTANVAQKSLDQLHNWTIGTVEKVGSTAARLIDAFIPF